MDHDTAQRSHVTERYILGELTPPERDEFEEHLADCSRCMDDVCTLDAFAANAHGAFEKPSAGRAAAKPKRWLELLGWPIPSQVSVALNLALLLVAGYERGRVIPGLEANVHRLERPDVSETPLLTAKTRALAQEPEKVSARFVSIKFDLTETYPSYSYTLEAIGGNYRLDGKLAVAPRAEELLLTVPTASLKPGDYLVQVYGWRGTQSKEIGGKALRLMPTRN